MYRAQRSWDTQAPGLACVMAYAKNMSSSDTYNTYWFPASTVDSVISSIEAETFDLTSSSYDVYIIDTLFVGMSQYSI